MTNTTNMNISPATQPHERPRRATAGFTMVEVLTAVAIIVILLAVAFVGIMRFQADMRQLELDGTAKEIYVAAQSHLILADNQGTLAKAVKAGKAGTRETVDGKQADTYYFVYTPGTSTTDVNSPSNPQSVLSQMLPYGSIDEGVRTGGSYIIRYNATTARVLDVFYGSPDEYLLQSSDAPTLLTEQYTTATNAKDARRDYKGRIVGYYQGDESLSVSSELEAPEVEVYNGDALVATAYAPGSPAKVTIVVEGRTSKAAARFTSDSATAPLVHTGDYYSVVLDDITTSQPNSKRFADVVVSDNGKAFIPGENLRVYAWVSGADASTVPAKSKNTVIANSLFATGIMPVKKPDGTTTPYTATIKNFRHLSNLATRVSGFNSTASTHHYAEVAATQMANLNWSAFGDDIVIGESLGRHETVITTQSTGTSLRTGAATLMSQAEAVKASLGATKQVVYAEGLQSKNTSEGKFLPVLVDYRLEYNGYGNSVSNVQIDETTSAGGNDAGLFASVDSLCEVKNLELIDFNVVGSNAGALAGTLHGGTVQNVLVRNSTGSTSVNVAGATAAGGLVGSMSGGTVSECAAAVVVQATSGNAGGLVGSASGTLRNSYSGGHTQGGVYATTTYDVTGSANAGGFAGALSGATVTNCYSTCSASGEATVGGFAGSATRSTATNCYATGKVNGNAAGAFVGGGSLSGQYIGAVNGLDVAGGGTSVDVDGTTAAFQAFALGAGSAVPYDTALLLSENTHTTTYNNNTLTQAYRGTYPYKNISELSSGTGSAADTATVNGRLVIHLTTHYGDWPAPEAVVENEKVS